jgi:hypothetical protein
MAEIGIGPGERQHHADLDRGRIGAGAQRKRQRGGSETGDYSHRVLPFLPIVGDPTISSRDKEPG